MPVDSRIRLWRAANDYIDLDYASARLLYQTQGERMRDRNGLLHRVAPAVEHYPSGMQISLLAEELTALNNAGAAQRLCLLDWLEQWYRLNAELMVYVLGESLSNEGTAIARRLACKVYIEELPEHYFGSMPIVGGGAEYVEFTAFVVEDGSFGAFDSLGSYLPRLRP